MSIIALLADAAPAASKAPGWAQMLSSQFFPIILGMAVLMFFLSRGGKNKDRAREDMLKQLKRGDRIQTIGGILGTVLRAEETRVEIKVDESNNTKIWFARSAIAKVVEAENAEAK